MNADAYADAADDEDGNDWLIRMELFNAHLVSIGGRCRLCSEPIFILVIVAERNHATGEVFMIPAALPFTSYMAWLNMERQSLDPVGTWCEYCDDPHDAPSHMQYMDDDSELLEMLMGARLTTDDQINLLKEKNDDK